MKKKISFLRLFILLGIITVAGLLYFNIGHIVSKSVGKEKVKEKPWFSSYVDATLMPQFDFEHVEGNLVLSFVVASDKDNSPSWGNAYSLDEAETSLDLERHIARVRQNNGDVVISFGGLINHELAQKHTAPKALMSAYESVVVRYAVNTIDLDLENEGLTDVAAGKVRAQAIAELQKKRKKASKPLAVWLTLPVSTDGLTSDGVNAVKILLDEDVELAGVNGMTMNFGETRKPDLSMGKNAIQALKKLHAQLKKIYQDKKIFLSDKAFWAKIGATPMIGQNDLSNEIFTLADAKTLNQFAQKSGLGRLSIWSANRDRASTTSSVHTNVVSNFYSGVEQEDQAFSKILKVGFEGNLLANTTKETVSDLTEEDLIDHPKTSPYQIWSKDITYLAKTKVVWQHNVYQAKWWTIGDEPNVPLTNSDANPWVLLGPVLKGEKPVSIPVLKDGTYESWGNEKVYKVGDRVMVGSNGYVAKWWNQDETPEKAIINPNDSPWRPMTESEIMEVLKK